MINLFCPSNQKSGPHQQNGYLLFFVFLMLFFHSYVAHFFVPNFGPMNEGMFQNSIFNVSVTFLSVIMIASNFSLFLVNSSTKVLYKEIPSWFQPPNSTVQRPCPVDVYSTLGALAFLNAIEQPGLDRKSVV